MIDRMKTLATSGTATFCGGRDRRGILDNTARRPPPVASETAVPGRLPEGLNFVKTFTITRRLK